MSTVYFVTGRAGAGKTTLAKKLAKSFDAILIDSDDLRKVYATGFSDAERIEHITRMAQLAELLRGQGHIVFIAAIMPKKEWRQKARSLVQESALLYVPGGTMWEGTEYEEPDNEEKPYRVNKDA